MKSNDNARDLLEEVGEATNNQAVTQEPPRMFDENFDWEGEEKNLVPGKENKPPDKPPHNPVIFQKFKDSILDQTKEYPDPVPVLNLVQYDTTHPLLTRKSYSLWQGKQKSKKTTVLAMAIASIISSARSDDPVRFESATDGVALFFDCEQGESYAARTMKLILRMANMEQSNRLIYCDLREYSPADRMEIIKAGIRATQNVALIIVDGVVDLMIDFMDSKEGHTTVIDLLKLSSIHDIHVAGVLHQNKGQSKDARAHVGSVSSQKCEREIMVEVDQYDRAQSIVTCKESRGIPFDDFAIRWDKGELPRILQDFTINASSGDKKNPKALSVKNPAEIDELTHCQILSEVFVALDNPTFKNLFTELSLVLKNKQIYASKHDLEQLIAWYKKEGMITQEGKTGTRNAQYKLSR